MLHKETLVKVRWISFIKCSALLSPEAFLKYVGLDISNAGITKNWSLLYSISFKCWSRFIPMKEGDHIYLHFANNHFSFYNFHFAHFVAFNFLCSCFFLLLVSSTFTLVFAFSCPQLYFTRIFSRWYIYPLTFCIISNMNYFKWCQ